MNIRQAWECEPTAALQSRWHAELAQHGIDLSPTQWEACQHFYALLLETNAHTNLTRLTSPEEFLYKQLWDSWLFADSLPEGATVMDLGSGGGFPVIPLAILRPDCLFTAVESVKKKAAFLERVATAMALPLSVCSERIEVLGQAKGGNGGKKYREQADVITSRGLASMPVLMEYALPLAKVGGTVLALKGPRWIEEVPQAQFAIETLGGELEAVLEPPQGVEALQHSFLVVVNKVSKTPKAYPREVGLPAKSPLV